jgi:hypothetical protein
MSTPNKNESKCVCACHDTEWNSAKKHAPVVHDRKCCENMNGSLSQEQASELHSGKGELFNGTIDCTCSDCVPQSTEVTEEKCESCLAGFSKEDIMGNCTCDTEEIKCPLPNCVGWGEHNCTGLCNVCKVPLNQEGNINCSVKHKSTQSTKVACQKFDCSKHNDGYGTACDDDHNPVPTQPTVGEWEEEFFNQFCRKYIGRDSTYIQWKEFKDDNANTVPCPNEIIFFIKQLEQEARQRTMAEALKFAEDRQLKWVEQGKKEERDKVVNDLKDICNRIRTEKGLSRALANYIAKLNQ